MVYLHPIGWCASGKMAAWRPDDERVINRPEIDGHYKSRKPRRKGNRKKMCPSVTIRRCGFMTEEALQKVPHQVRKGASLRRDFNTECSLSIQGTHFGSRERE